MTTDLNDNMFLRTETNTYLEYLTWECFHCDCQLTEARQDLTQGKLILKFKKNEACKQSVINKHSHSNKKIVNKPRTDVCKEADLPKRPRWMPANKTDLGVCISNRNCYEDNEKCQTFQQHAEHGCGAAPFPPSCRSSFLDLIGWWASWAERWKA